MELTFNVANIVFSVNTALSEESLLIPENYKDFICDGQPFIEISGSYGIVKESEMEDLTLIFDSEENWSLYRKDKKHLFILKVPDGSPFCIAQFDSDYRNGTIEVSADFFKGYEGSRLPFPLFYPLSEIFMICFLARERGLMVHACGINDKGKGYLLAGNSGHGKSTSAKLWKSEATILNDDRIVIRFREGRFWMYGTPWHGDYTATSPEGVPLESIYFLKHAGENKMEPVKGARALSMLLARAFPPFWDAEGMDYSLRFLNELVDAIPCRELSFLPDKEVINFVRCAS